MRCCELLLLLLLPVSGLEPFSAGLAVGGGMVLSAVWSGVLATLGFLLSGFLHAFSWPRSATACGGSAAANAAKAANGSISVNARGLDEIPIRAKMAVVGTCNEGF